jgi:tripartite-type tricarboxylate transporter receptor subunit TctC
MISKNKRAFILGAIAVAGAAAMTSPVWAQAASAWPTKPVTMVVGFAAGGPTDFIARLLAEQLSKKFGQSFIIDNKAGAGGRVAAGLVKRAAPDGYTLMLGSNSTLSIAPTLYKNLPYDSLRDFTAVGLVASYPYFLTVPASSPYLKLDDLLKKGADPASTLNYGSAGNGAVNHLAGEWFKHEAKINATHIPYSGDAATISDLIAGRLDFAFIAGAAARPQVEAGKLRILASASAVPGRGGDNVPTLGESRYKGFATEPWNGVMAPAGPPQEIVVKLNHAINEIMNRKDIVDRLASMEQFPLTGTPSKFTSQIKEETARWSTVIKNAGIKVE